jgi:hypothetical protein
MIPSSENEVAYRKLCAAIAVMLSLTHVLSVCGMAYQSHWRVDHYMLVNFSIWLSPVLLPLLSKKSYVLVMICAIPILVIFFARIHFAWQLYSLGTNSIRPNGDWAWWLATWLGAISIFVVVLWSFFRAAIFFTRYVNRSGNRSEGMNK